MKLANIPAAASRVHEQQQTALKSRCVGWEGREEDPQGITGLTVTSSQEERAISLPRREGRGSAALGSPRTARDPDFFSILAPLTCLFEMEDLRAEGRAAQ